MARIPAPCSNATHVQLFASHGRHVQEANLTWRLRVDLAIFAVGLVLAACHFLWRHLRQRKELSLPALAEEFLGSGLCPAGCRHRGASPEGAKRRPGLGEPLLPSSSPSTAGRRCWIGSLMEDKPTTFKNYFRYLITCCCTFLILFIVSQCIGSLFKTQGTMVDVHDDPVAAILLWPGPLFQHTSPVNYDGALKWVYTLAVLNGLICLAATFLLERWCEQPVVSEEVSRTLMVHGLPVKDQRLNPFVSEYFRLNVDQLQRVGTDIAAALNETLLEKREAARPVAPSDEGVWVVDEWNSWLPRGTPLDPSPGWSAGGHIGAKGIHANEHTSSAIFVVKRNAASRTDRVWVTPEVQKWMAASTKLERADRQQKAYQVWALKFHGNTCWDTALRKWYTFWSKRRQKDVRKHAAELLMIRLQKMRTAGSAFVRFRSHEDCKSLLGRPPKWWDCGRWGCWFNTLKFGHVPFSSVTLEFEPAPHPDDINWQNMHTPRWQSELLFALLTVALILAMLVIVTPINVPRYLEVLPFGDQISQHFASLLLLFINRTVLPFPIEWIALAGRFRRKTEGELRQMHLNFWLLIINTALIPLLGMKLLQDLPSTMSNGLFSFVQCVSFDSLMYTRRRFIGYFFDVTFLTNLYQVIVASLYDLCGFLQRKLTAVRSRDQDTAQPYAFGYYYAWTLSIVALALGTGIEVPGTLLIAALCFFIKILVDWRNLTTGVYKSGPEHEGVFSNTVILYLRTIVSACWLLTGLGTFTLCSGTEEQECPPWSQLASTVLMALALLVFVASLGRAGYRAAMRRFIAGRLTVEPEVDSDADTATPDVGGQIDRAESQCGLTWDATPPFRWAEVEQLVGDIGCNKKLIKAVKRSIARGCSVSEASEGLSQIRRTKSCRF